MDAAAHYRHLVALGREEFLAAAAPAAFLRVAAPRPGAAPVDLTVPLDDETIDVAPAARGGGEPEVLPLVKKPGASFPDRITIGRTSNNDLVIADASVSRLHAYVRPQAAGWVVADAGSKNGSWLRGEPLEPRRERELPSKTVLRIGEVSLTFLAANDLYDALGGA